MSEKISLDSSDFQNICKIEKTVLSYSPNATNKRKPLQTFFNLCFQIRPHATEHETQKFAL